MVSLAVNLLRGCAEGSLRPVARQETVQCVRDVHQGLHSDELAQLSQRQGLYACWYVP